MFAMIHVITTFDEGETDDENENRELNDAGHEFIDVFENLDEMREFVLDDDEGDEVFVTTNSQHDVIDVIDEIVFDEIDEIHVDDEGGDDIDI